MNHVRCGHIHTIYHHPFSCAVTDFSREAISTNRMHLATLIISTDAFAFAAAAVLFPIVTPSREFWSQCLKLPAALSLPRTLLRSGLFLHPERVYSKPASVLRSFGHLVPQHRNSISSTFKN